MVDSATGAPIGELVTGEPVLGITAGLEVNGGNDGLFVADVGIPVIKEAIGTTAVIGWSDGI